MKRKMLISIALIMIMLLNCMMPLFVVNAATGEEIQLNSKLYKAIKEDLSKQGIIFECNDITHTLTLSSEVLSSITELNLNEGAIADLTGIDVFTSLTHLELSGNNLSKESNLAVLNNLTSLNYLDLSTNQLDDVSEISSLISSLKENGTIVLSGQTITQVQSVYVDNHEESDMISTATFELPSILELAGYLKSAWKTEERFSEDINPVKSSLYTPYIVETPMYVTAEDKTIEIKIADEYTGAGYYGLVKFTIYIYDDATEAAQANNPNKAAENILNGSRFYLYYVVHDGSSEAITTMDSNLYQAIKEQLTGGQYGKFINPELSSYPYVVDVDGNIIYEEFTYTTEEIDGTSYQVLTNTVSGEVKYAYDPILKELYAYDGTAIEYTTIDTIMEPIEIKVIDESGNISVKAGYKVAFTNEDCGETLYIAAYDEARTFVIDDLVLTNKITSLILNNRQIRDLSGIEYFVGLASELNVSHNYLSDIDPIYNLETQKEYWESQIVESYTHWLRNREYGNLAKSTSEVVESYENVQNNIKSIEKLYTNIINLLKEAATADATAQGYEDSINGKANSISSLLVEVYGHTDAEGNYVEGYLDKISNALYDYEEQDGLYYEIGDMYTYLRYLYSIYSNEYKLTTLLCDSLNYQTYDEYEAYLEKTKASRDSAKELLTEQISYLASLEANKGLSDFDKMMFTEMFGINFESDKTNTPLADYFNKMLEETALNRVEIVELLDIFREMGIYSEMANYCLIERMNNETPEGFCYEEKYLEKRIKELGYEDIDTSMEEVIFEALKNETTAGYIGSIYDEYNQLYVTFTDEDGNTKDIYYCQGNYNELDEITFDYTAYTADELIEAVLAEAPEGKSEQVQAVLDLVTVDIIKNINLYENVDGYTGTANELVMYNQLMSLANKLLNGNVDRYVTLPRLKKLDISYNADLDNLEGLPQLTSISDLNAAYCYIADVTNVEWGTMTNLRRLNLAYNYISDISPITELTTLRYLNLSNNLIAGSLEINEYQYQKLFKKLENFDLSGNQITDITSLLIYLDHITNGDYANYIAREDTIDINLNNQNIVMELNEPIQLADYPTTIDIELPRIFTQLLAIDVNRTAFGETSQGGRIESEGTYVTLNTRTPGNKTAEVVVLAMSGNGTVVDTCVGEGTKATIKYTVIESGVTGMTVEPSEDAKVNVGETLQFTAEVEGTDLSNTNVNWSVERQTSTNTTISSTGLLTVGEDEKSETLVVVATADADQRMKVRINVTVLGIENSETNPDAGTNTPGEGETTPTDPDVEVDVVNPSDLGYEPGEEFVTGISPKTSVEDFTTILLNGKEYKVVIKKDGETITSGNMATGMYVQIQDENGNVVKDENGDLLVYEVIVNGDVNGDGLADSLDSILIKAHRNEITSLAGDAFEAADINDDGKVNIADTKLLLYHRAEVKGYDLNFSK